MRRLEEGFEERLDDQLPDLAHGRNLGHGLRGILWARGRVKTRWGWARLDVWRRAGLVGDGVFLDHICDDPTENRSLPRPELLPDALLKQQPTLGLGGKRSLLCGGKVGRGLVKKSQYGASQLGEVPRQPRDPIDEPETVPRRVIQHHLPWAHQIRARNAERGLVPGCMP